MGFFGLAGLAGCKDMDVDSYGNERVGVGGVILICCCYAWEVWGRLVGEVSYDEDGV